MQGASGRYATDYWVNIMPEAVQDLQSYIAKVDQAGGADRRYTVGACGERASFEDEASSRLEWVQDWQQAEFFIAPTHMNCDRALDGKVIATISRLGVPIGVVKNRCAIMQHDVARKAAAGSFVLTIHPIGRRA